MAVVLNDNNKVASYRIEVETNDNQVLVTEGKADVVSVGRDGFNDVINLTGRAVDRTQSYEPSRKEEAPAQVEEPVDTDPEPQAPIKPRVAPAKGTNPYVSPSVFLDEQRFMTGYGDEYYELECDGHPDKIILTVRDESDDMAVIYLTDEERIKMAIRLLSVTPDTVLVSDGVNIFEPADDAHSPKAIGGAIFTLHSALKSAEYEKALEEYRTEHDAWKKRQASHANEIAESKALNDLVVREFIRIAPGDEEYIRETEANFGLKNGLPFSYRDYRANVLERLEDAGLTAVQQLAKELGDEKADTSEGDALDAIAFNDVLDEVPWIYPETLTNARNNHKAQFEAARAVAEELVNKLGVTAVKYLEARGFEYPAK